MTAGHDRCELLVTPGTARKNIAYLIDRSRTSGFFAPLDKKISPLTIKVG